MIPVVLIEELVTEEFPINAPAESSSMEDSDVEEIDCGGSNNDEYLGDAEDTEGMDETDDINNNSSVDSPAVSVENDATMDSSSDDDSIEVIEIRQKETETVNQEPKAKSDQMRFRNTTCNNQTASTSGSQSERRNIQSNISSSSVDSDTDDEDDSAISPVTPVSYTFRTIYNSL